VYKPPKAAFSGKISVTTFIFDSNEENTSFFSSFVTIINSFTIFDRLAITRSIILMPPSLTNALSLLSLLLLPPVKTIPVTIFRTS
jgi:hypothetical protein